MNDDYDYVKRAILHAAAMRPRRGVVHVHHGKTILCGCRYERVTSTSVSEDATCRRCRVLAGESVGKNEEE